MRRGAVVCIFLADACALAGAFVSIKFDGIIVKFWKLAAVIVQGVLLWQARSPVAVVVPRAPAQDLDLVATVDGLEIRRVALTSEMDRRSARGRGLGQGGCLGRNAGPTKSGR